MPSQLNEKIVNEYRDLLANVSSCLVVDYQGISVEQATAFRRAFRDKQLQVEVVRNALASLVIKEKGYAELDQVLSGPVALIFTPQGQSDEATIAAAKTFVEWKKKAGGDKPAIKGALFEGQVLDSSRAEGPGQDARPRRGAGPARRPDPDRDAGSPSQVPAAARSRAPPSRRTSRGLEKEGNTSEPSAPEANRGAEGNVGGTQGQA
ncbi:MAG: 50S ribosomal protein L10 [Planctomycetota bacterium]